MKRTFSMITPEFHTILRSERVKVKAARTTFIDQKIVYMSLDSFITKEYVNRTNGANGK